MVDPHAHPIETRSNCKQTKPVNMGLIYIIKAKLCDQRKEQQVLAQNTNSINQIAQDQQKNKEEWNK